jgi:hypothetical protein
MVDVVIAIARHVQAADPGSLSSGRSSFSDGSLPKAIL